MEGFDRKALRTPMFLLDSCMFAFARSKHMFSALLWVQAPDSQAAFLGLGNAGRKSAANHQQELLGCTGLRGQFESSEKWRRETATLLHSKDVDLDSPHSGAGT